jgi:hypothetical protein
MYLSAGMYDRNRLVQSKSSHSPGANADLVPEFYIALLASVEAFRRWINIFPGLFKLARLQDVFRQQKRKQKLLDWMVASITLPVVLYGCETWSLTLREEHILRVFENRVLRTEEGWSDRRLEKLHNEELHNLYSSPSIIRMIKWRRMRWAGNVARMGEEECT